MGYLFGHTNVEIPILFKAVYMRIGLAAKKFHMGIGPHHLLNVPETQQGPIGDGDIGMTV